MRFLKLAMLLLFLFACAANKVLTTSLSNPESAFFDATSGYLYVSNVAGKPLDKDGVGFISKLSFEGKMLEKNWVTGLNAPKGMRSFKGKLWVTDIDRVVRINIVTGKIERKIRIPGSVFLNDIDIDQNGNVYVSDMLTNKIHKLSLNQKYSPMTFIEGKELESPNGLLIIDNKLFIASWGTHLNPADFSVKEQGRIQWVSLTNGAKKVTPISPRFGNLDGLEVDKNGNFIVSDWVAGKLYRVSNSGAIELISERERGMADIGISEDKKYIFAPMMNSNQLIKIAL